MHSYPGDFDYMPRQLYVHYTASTGIECCLVAQSIAHAARVLGTYSATVNSRSKTYDSADQVPEELHQAMSLAVENVGAVIIRDGDTWRRLSGDPAKVLLDSRQRSLKGSKNAQQGDSPMRTRSLTSDDETWSNFLELGGSGWFREVVRREYKTLKGSKKG